MQRKLKKKGMNRLPVWLWFLSLCPKLTKSFRRNLTSHCIGEILNKVGGIFAFWMLSLYNTVCLSVPQFVGMFSTPLCKRSHRRYVFGCDQAALSDNDLLDAFLLL